MSERRRERGIVTPESAAIEGLDRKLSGRVDTYLEKLETISAAQGRQARRSLWAAIASAICAVTLAAVGVVSLLPDDHDTAFARCEMAQMSAASPPKNFLSVCMSAAGYWDWCSTIPPGSAEPGQTPECFVPGNWRTRLRNHL